MPLIGKNIVYVACPKTGSTWVRRVLLSVGEELRTGDGDRHIVGNATHYHLPVLTTIRHPLSWVVSAYRWKHFHRGRREIKAFPGPAGVLNDFPTDFDGWVSAIVRDSGVVGRIFQPYVEVADHVIRQEYLAEGLASVLRGFVSDDEARKAVARERSNETKDAPSYSLTEDQEEALAASEAEFIGRWY